MTFSLVAEKTSCCREVILAVGNTFSVVASAVAVVERFQRESMYRLSAGTEKRSRDREVAVIGGSTIF